jgi:hypothetical protein
MTHGNEAQGVYTWHINKSCRICCSVLQCVAVCCSVLQCVAMCCSVVSCGVLQWVAVCCSVLQCVAVCCSVLQWVAVCCRVHILHVWTPIYISIYVYATIYIYIHEWSIINICVRIQETCCTEGSRNALLCDRNNHKCMYEQIYIFTYMDNQ